MTGTDLIEEDDFIANVKVCITLDNRETAKDIVKQLRKVRKDADSNFFWASELADIIERK